MTIGAFMWHAGGRWLEEKERGDFGGPLKYITLCYVCVCVCVCMFRCRSLSQWPPLDTLIVQC